MEEYNRNPENRPLSKPRDGSLNRNEEEKQKKDKRAALNRKKGDFSGDEKARPTGDPSALPGAEEERDIGDKASGAGLGGNKGKGTRTPGEFD